MASAPMRVPDETYREVQGASRVLDCTPGELLRRAWEAYRETPEFREEFAFAQKAFQTGDLQSIVNRLEENARARAQASVDFISERRRR